MGSSGSGSAEIPVAPTPTVDVSKAAMLSANQPNSFQMQPPRQNPPAQQAPQWGQPQIGYQQRPPQGSY